MALAVAGAALAVLAGAWPFAGTNHVPGMVEQAGAAGSVATMPVRSRVAVNERKCGDANGDDSVTAVDSLIVLQAATEATSSNLCVCDVDSSGTIVTTDSLLVLQFSIGLGVELECIPCATTVFPITMSTTTTVTTTSTSTTVMAGFQLTVSIDPLEDDDSRGTGTVEDNRNGIDCPGDCSEIYAEDTEVTLSATTATCSSTNGGSEFVEWTGDTPENNCPDTGDCMFKMGMDRDITAVFNEVCPKDAAIQDLEKDCSDQGYFYQLGPLGEGLSTDGTAFDLIQLNEEQGFELTYDGTVTGTTTFTLESVTLSGTSTDLATGSGGSIDTSDSTLDVTVILDSGQQEDFNDASFLGEACISSSSSAPLTGGVRDERAGSRALEREAESHARALARLVEALSR